jgi:hypothetical protein
MAETLGYFDERSHAATVPGKRRRLCDRSYPWQTARVFHLRGCHAPGTAFAKRQCRLHEYVGINIALTDFNTAGKKGICSMPDVLLGVQIAHTCIAALANLQRNDFSRHFLVAFARSSSIITYPISCSIFSFTCALAILKRTVCKLLIRSIPLCFPKHCSVHYGKAFVSGAHETTTQQATVLYV